MLLAHMELWKTFLEFFSRNTVVLCTFSATLYYLWGRKVQAPVLVCGNGFRSFLLKYCPVVSENYRPTPWCWGGQLQTVIHSFIKSSPPASYRNELIRTDDGGQISLHWMDNGSSVAYPESSTRPTVLILPGLTGNAHQSYVLHIVSQAARRGYRCVVFNNRGCAGEELLTPRTFCAADTSDLERVVLHVKELYPEAPLLGAGVSLGGMLLVNYLARKGSESGMMAAITLSVVWNTEETTISTEKPIDWLLFNRYLARRLCDCINSHRKSLEKIVDIDYMMKARTVREFDERVTNVMFGYKSTAEYYKDANPDVRLHRATVPIVCLNAADDPLCPKHTIPLAQAQRVPNVALVVTAHGGHVAFLEGLFPSGEGYIDRLFGQFVQAVFEHPEELMRSCSIKEELAD